MNNKIKIFYVVILSIMANFSIAEIDFKGFASVGAGIFSEDDFEYDGVKDSFSSTRYNRFGLQMSTKVNESTTFTSQFVARGTDDYEVKAEWLYLTIKLNSSTNLRVGRIRSPLFFFSDFLEVGYAYPWIVPPPEIYRLNIFSGVDGFDLVNNHDIGGDWTGAFQAYFGESNSETFKLNDFGGLNYTLNNGWLSLRASYNFTEYDSLTPDLAALANGLSAIGATAAAEALNPQEEKADFWGLGINLDLEKILFTAEYTSIVADKQTLVSDDVAWYAMFGYRIGSFTPNITYSYSENDPDFTFLNSIPAIDDPTINALRAGASSIVTESEDTSIIVGLRYDYAPGTAFKVAITTIDQDKQDQDGTLFSFSIDTVF